MTDSIGISLAGWRDWRGVQVLEKACFGPDAWGSLDVLAALLGGSSLRLKATAGRRLVGFVMGEPHPADGYAWIATLGVHPEFQRQGIGARLLRETEARLAPALLKLTVRQSNLPAIKLYEKFGYMPMYTWEHYYASGEAGIVMEKRRA